MTVALTLYAWAFIVMLFGLAQRFLNRPSKALTYFTGAVFCYYILHQTIIVSAGYYLTQMQLGAWPEFLILTAITIAGCAGGYELLRRVPGVRLWFGIRASKIAALAPALSAARFSLDGARE
jgi:membrane-bound acyltransferase YfiQ involved in biofilm formation